MNTRQRPPVQRPDDSTPSSEAGSDRLGEIRQRARALAEAGEQAIERALSGDSDRFLKSSRQQGGQ